MLKHPSRSAEAAPGVVAAFIVSFRDGWLEVDDEQRPPRVSSNLRTAALRGGGSGVVAFLSLRLSLLFLLCWLK